jgi:hypothetical protein
MAKVQHSKVYYLLPDPCNNPLSFTNRRSYTSAVLVIARRLNNGLDAFGSIIVGQMRRINCYYMPFLLCRTV